MKFKTIKTIRYTIFIYLLKDGLVHELQSEANVSNVL